ncbi:MAG: protein kinase [Verrucomicrobiia bacterium]
MSASSSTCPKCGGQVPLDAPANLCPGCLMRGGIEPEGLEEESKSRYSGYTETLHIVIPEDAPLFRGLPRQLGSYELLDVIAEGGMGVVYRARHTGLDRVVALKMIRSGVLASSADVERFQREARSAAKLRHPNVVTIHDIGEQDGQHYFTMDYVPGANLAERARTAPFSAREAAEITAGVTAAIQYAHQHQVLHRDIKPANVILTPERQPRVLDFGLALVLTDDSNLTLSGAPMGSPPYMPPEQAAGQTRRIDARSDVYSLGALLYELLTGRPPFQAASALETLKLVMENEPVPPRRLNPELPRDLETICLKCLEKAPERRYQTAQELNDELGRFVRDEPILARPVPRVERAWRWCRRKPVVAGLAATLLALFLSVGIGSPIALHRIDLERRKARNAHLEARRLLYAADMNQAHQSVRQNNVGRARRLLDRHRPGPGEQDLRGWEWRYLWQLCQSEALAVLARRPASCCSLGFSADGTRLAAGYSDGRVELWNLGTRRLEVLQLENGDTPARVAFAPEADFLAVSAEPGTVKLHDLQNGRATTLWQDSASVVRHLSYSRDGALLAVYTYPRLAFNRVLSTSAKVVLFDTVHGKKVGTHAAGHASSFFGVAALSPDHKRLYIGSSDAKASACSIRSINLEDDRENWTIAAGHDDGVTAIAISPDGAMLVSGTGSEGSTIRVWDAATGAPVKSLEGHTGWVEHLAFSRYGRLLASAAADQSLRLWDLASWSDSTVLRGHADEVHAVSFSPDGRLLASGGKDGTLMLWDLGARRPDRSHQSAPPELCWVDQLGEKTGLGYDGPRKNLTVVQFDDLSLRDVPLPLGELEEFIGSGRGSLFNMTDWTNRLSFYELDGATPRLLKEIQLEEPLSRKPLQTYLVNYCLEKRLAAWGTPSGVVHVMPLDKPEKRFAFNTGLHEILLPAFSPDGKLLVVSAPERKKLQVWNLTTRTAMLECDVHVVASAFFANGGRTLVFVNQGTAAHEVIFWDLAEPRKTPVRRPVGTVGRSQLALSPDGRLLAVPTREGSVAVFDVKRMERPAVLHGHMQSVLGVAFSPDGKRLVSTSGAGEAVKIWDVETGQELLTLKGKGSQLLNVAFVADGNSLLVGSKGKVGTWQLWCAPSLTEIENTEVSGGGWSTAKVPARSGPGPK